MITWNWLFGMVPWCSLNMLRLSLKREQNKKQKLTQARDEEKIVKII
jgi:hypothetical protein